MFRRRGEGGDEDARLVSFQKQAESLDRLLLETQRKEAMQIKGLPFGSWAKRVGNHLQALTQALQEEGEELTGDTADSGASHNAGPCLQHLFNGTLLNTLCQVCLPDRPKGSRCAWLRGFHALVSQVKQPVLIHEGVLSALDQIITACHAAPTTLPDGEGPGAAKLTAEESQEYVGALAAVSRQVVDDPAMLALFFDSNRAQVPGQDRSPTVFPVFSALVPFMHVGDGAGAAAREALLQCMQLCHTREDLVDFVLERSGFCEKLAGGFSGLYSAIPSALPEGIKHAWALHESVVQEHLPQLALFLESLRFCNGVMQIAPERITQRVSALLFSGFMAPVVGPALAQPSDPEATAATAIFDIALRTATVPLMQRPFLKLLLTPLSEEQQRKRQAAKRAQQQQLQQAQQEKQHKQQKQHKQKQRQAATAAKQEQQNGERKQQEAMLVPELSSQSSSSTSSLDSAKREGAPHQQTPAGGSAAGSAAAAAAAAATAGNTPNNTASSSSASASNSSSLPSTPLFVVVSRIEAKGDLCLASLRLLNTLLDLHCEDVVYELCLKQLLKGEHLVPQVSSSSSSPAGSRSHSRSASMDSSFSAENGFSSTSPLSSGPSSASGIAALHKQLLDIVLCKDAKWFLELRPVPNSSPGGTSFEHYLCDARERVSQSRSACRCWAGRYDRPAPELFGLPAAAATKELLPPAEEERGVSSGSFWNATKSSVGGLFAGLKKRVGSESREKEAAEARDSSFLACLLRRLSKMLHNPLQVNLQLTGVVSRLAQHPAPLLRDFFLNPNLPIAPEQPSFANTLSAIAQEAQQAETSIDDFVPTLYATRKSLDPKPKGPGEGENGGKSANGSVASSPRASPKLLRKVVASITRRGSDPEKPQNLEPPNGIADALLVPAADPFGDALAQAEAQKPNAPTANGVGGKAAEGKKKVGVARLKRMALGVLIFEELLKELSALSLEQGLWRIDQLATS